MGLGEGAPDVVSTLQTVNDTLTNIQKLLETEYHLKIEDGEAVSTVTTFKEMWDGIQNKSITLWATVKKSIIEFITKTPSDDGDVEVNGTAHAKGTAHKTGNWGLPKDEHDSLVGELGTELVNL